MERVCKDHNRPIQAICTTCKGLLCIKCNVQHIKQGCKHSIDLPSFATTELLPKYKSLIDDFEERKYFIEALVSSFVGSTEGIQQGLLQLRERLATLLDEVNRGVEALAKGISHPSLMHGTIKMLLVNEYNQLTHAIQEEDLNYIISKLNDQELVNVVGLGGNKKRLVKSIHNSIDTLLKSQEIKTLSDSLSLLVSTYGKFAEQYAPKITNKFVYGTCDAQSDYKRLCRYDVESGKLRPCVDVPRMCTVTQVGKLVFVSGGLNPLSNALYEFAEDSLFLVPKASMKYGKYGHKTEPVTMVEFASIGGHNGVSAVAYCEQYSVQEDEWRPLPSLNRPRHYPAAALLNYKSLYVVGGYGVADSIEVLDVAEKVCWEKVKLAFNEISFSNSPAAFPVSIEEIMIYQGGNSVDAGILNVAQGTINKVANCLKKEYYYTNPVCIIKKTAYVIGDYYGHIHIHQIPTKQFKDVDYSQACT